MASSATRTALQSSIAILQQASAAEMHGDAETAAQLYGAAIASFDSLLRYLPDGHKGHIERQLGHLREKTLSLQEEKRKRSLRSEFPAFAVNMATQSQMRTGVDFCIPQATVHRPFWLMRNLSKSIQEGTFITPHLFVSKQIWHQDCAHTTIAFIPAKAKFFAFMCELMGNVHQLHLGDTLKLLKGLSNFLKDAEAAKAELENDMGKKADSRPQRSRFERGVRELLNRGSSVLKNWKLQQDASYQSYLAWSVNALEQAQVFQQWIYFFSHNENSKHSGDVVEKLHAISAFFYFGPCSILLHDALLLVDTYASHGRESLSRLLPVAVKVSEDPM